MGPRVLAFAILLSPSLIAWTIPLPGRDAVARFSRRRSAAASPLNVGSRAAIPLSGGSMDAAPRPGPAGAYDKAVNLGAKKASLPWQKILPLAIASGGHVALGAFTAISIGGSIPNIKASNPGLQRLVYGAFGLPLGLLLTLCVGGEVSARANLNPTAFVPRRFGRARARARPRVHVTRGVRFCARGARSS